MAGTALATSVNAVRREIRDRIFPGMSDSPLDYRLSMEFLAANGK
jgi:hypothetical protein